MTDTTTTGGARRAFEARLRRQRRTSSFYMIATAGTAIPVLLMFAHIGSVDPQRLATGLPRLTEYVGATMPMLRIDQFSSDLANWMWGIRRWLGLILDTLVIAFLGTLIGGLLAFITSFMAARNLAPTPFLGGIARRVLEVARTVPELVFALIFVYAFGVGPFAGVLAIILHSWGALGKLTAEVNENIDMKPLEGAVATGGSWLSNIRFAAIPQMMPTFTSYALFRFEINVRAASVLGIVGAGGIGQELYFVVRQFEYKDISAIIVLIILLVSTIDIISGWVRHKLIGQNTIAAV